MSYGNGVPTAINAVKSLYTDPRLSEAIAASASAAASTSMSQVEFTVVDTPCLSCIPRNLVELFFKPTVNPTDLTNPTDCTKRFDAVVFADVCKEGAGMPLAGISCSLHNRGT